jgi:type I restriction enzyme, R subunit
MWKPLSRTHPGTRFAWPWCAPCGSRGLMWNACPRSTDTFVKLIDRDDSLNAEQRRAVDEGLSEDQLALFDLVRRADLTKVDRERIKPASKELLAGVLKVIAMLDHWTEKEQTQAEVEIFILNHVYQERPEPPYKSDDKAHVAQLVYRHIWPQSVRHQLSGDGFQ